MIIQLDSKVIW